MALHDDPRGAATAGAPGGQTPENAPLLSATDRSTGTTRTKSSSSSSSSYIKHLRLAASPLLFKVVAASLCVGAVFSGVAHRLGGMSPLSIIDPSTKFFVGLTNDEGLGAMLTHIGCYADLARGSNRRLVVVPQYTSRHYTDSPVDAPAMEYAKYINLNILAPGYVRWEDAPEAGTRERTTRSRAFTQHLIARTAALQKAKLPRRIPLVCFVYTHV